MLQVLLFLQNLCLSNGVLQIGLITSPFTDNNLVNHLHDELDGLEDSIKNALYLQFNIKVYWAEVDLITETKESD